MAEEFSLKPHSRFFKACLRVMPTHYEKQDLVGSLDDAIGDQKQNMIDWIYNCQLAAPLVSKNNAGFRGSPFFGYKYQSEGAGGAPNEFDQGHIAMNYCALCLLAILGDDFSRINKPAMLSAVREWQLKDGSFAPVSGGAENDMRFLYCASAICFMLDDFSGMDVELAVQYVLSAQNYDGGIGQGNGRESHGGSTFCAISALTLMGRLDSLGDDRKNRLIKWATALQITGFQGRLNKPPDACYAFWIGSSLKLLGVFDTVNRPNLASFLRSCECADIGGFGKHPDTHPDVLHTYYSLVGLTYASSQDFGLKEVDPSLGISLEAARTIAATKLQNRAK